MSNNCSAYNIPTFISPVSQGMVISAQTGGNSTVESLSVGGKFIGLYNPNTTLFTSTPITPNIGIIDGSFPEAPEFDSTIKTLQNGGPFENYSNKRGSQIVTNSYSYSLGLISTPPNNTDTQRILVNGVLLNVTTVTSVTNAQIVIMNATSTSGIGNPTATFTVTSIPPGNWTVSPAANATGFTPGDTITFSQVDLIANGFIGTAGPIIVTIGAVTTYPNTSAALGISDKIVYVNNLSGSGNPDAKVIGEYNTFAPKDWHGTPPQLSDYINARNANTGAPIYSNPQQAYDNAYARFIASQSEAQPNIVPTNSIRPTRRVINEKNPTFAQFGDTFVFANLQQTSLLP